MRVTFAAAMPFNSLILYDLGRACELAGHDVRLVEHVPDGPHDFLQHSRHLGAFRRQLAETKPDIIVASDYPYGFLREAAPGAIIVGTRHSLAARGNTWEPEHAEADYIVSWSAWDESEFMRRRVAPRRGFLRAGPVWGKAPNAEERAAVRDDFKALDGFPLVLWAPTWNKECIQDAAVIPQLAALQEHGIRVAVRFHVATYWRHLEIVAKAKKAGLAIDTHPLRPLAHSIASADVVISDTSGAGLMPILWPQIDVRPLYLDPDPGFRDLQQYDRHGPEWVFRDLMGPRVAPGGDIAEAVLRLLDCDERLAGRQTVARIMLGTTPEADPCARLVGLLEEVMR